MGNRDLCTGVAVNKIKHMPLGWHQGSKEKYPKAREFGKDGEPIRDIEFTDHCRPEDHPLPHQHQRKENSSGGTKERGDPEEVPEWNYGENE